MFGKEAKYWKSTKSILAELIGADEDLTDAELVQAALDFQAEQEEADDDTEGDEKKKPEPVKTAKKAEKPEVEPEEEEEPENTLESKVDKILLGMDAMTKRVAAIEKLPFRGATSGEKTKTEGVSKQKYSEAQAPKFVD